LDYADAMNELKSPLRTARSYERDFYAWTAEQARELRRLKPERIDWENLAEEVESLGRSDKRAIGSDLKIVLEHLIKWKFQPEKRSDSWSDSIEEHRDRIARIIEDSPSLASTPGEILAREYLKARRKALRDTNLPQRRIPASCPFKIEDVLDPDFLPDADGR
jgi:hypothetical protein